MSGVTNLHQMIEHLIRDPESRAQVRQAPEQLFERFAIPLAQQAVLKTGSRDELYALGMHPNFVIKWLIWSGRPTMPFFPLNYYFSRR